MRLSDKDLIERSRLIPSDIKLMMSSEDLNKKLKRESWNRNQEELMLNKLEFITKWTEPLTREPPSIIKLPQDMNHSQLNV
jgi:hypothetical protein